MIMHYFFFSKNTRVSSNHLSCFCFCFLLFFQMTSLIRWSFSWWPPPGTLCPLSAFQTNCAVGLLFNCHPETSLSCALGFDTPLSGSHVYLLLSLVLLLIGTCPASQETDMGSKFSESQHVKKCPFLPSHLINDLAGYYIPSGRSCSLRFLKSLLHYWLTSSGVYEESNPNSLHKDVLTACTITGTAQNTAIQKVADLPPSWSLHFNVENRPEKKINK